ncbi:MAG TPA: hypothetical protein VLG50_05805 [Candidatus Saccharimonadales bacterium]|nr:hypothetical protein [Candidatus Saccharimonadales bacterium]
MQRRHIIREEKFISPQGQCQSPDLPPGLPPIVLDRKQPHSLHTDREPKLS